MRVLLYFLRHKQTVSYPAKLAVELQLPEVSVRRALADLVSRRILVSQPTRYRHYFSRR